MPSTTTTRRPALAAAITSDDIWRTRSEFNACASDGWQNTGLSALLRCGHWSEYVHDCSSDWDFPEDQHFCPEGCGLVNYDERVIQHLARLR